MKLRDVIVMMVFIYVMIRTFWKQYTTKLKKNKIKKRDLMQNEVSTELLKQSMNIFKFVSNPLAVIKGDDTQKIEWHEREDNWELSMITKAHKSFNAMALETKMLKSNLGKHRQYNYTKTEMAQVFTKEYVTKYEINENKWYQQYISNNDDGNNDDGDDEMAGGDPNDNNNNDSNTDQEMENVD